MFAAPLAHPLKKQIFSCGSRPLRNTAKPLPVIRETSTSSGSGVKTKIQKVPVLLGQSRLDQFWRDLLTGEYCPDFLRQHEMDLTSADLFIQLHRFQESSALAGVQSDLGRKPRA